MIQIHILRISSDGQFLEFNVEAPENYTFTSLVVVRYDPITKQDLDPIDITVALNRSSNVEILRVSTLVFGADSTMYKLTFKAARNSGVDEQEVVGYCSNVSFVYVGMLDNIMKLTASCIKEPEVNALNRNNLILHAHTEAMRLGRVEDAKYFYNIIWNNFSRCPVSGRYPNSNTLNCGC